MVCQACRDLLESHEGAISIPTTLYLRFRHHNSAEALEASVSDGCLICSAVSNKIKALKAESLNGADVDGARVEFLTARREWVETGPPQLYRLDFEIGVEDSLEVVASFILEQIIPQSDGRAPTNNHAVTRSATTSSREVRDLAKQWIEECASKDGEHVNCRHVATPSYYPTRLLDLRGMRDYKEESQRMQNLRNDPATQQKLSRSNTFAGEFLVEANELESLRYVELVSRKKGEKRHGEIILEGQYVTLSHRWGGAKFMKLRRDNLFQMQDRIWVLDLPKSFQDAIDFACELDGVNWLWIDALCIIQDEPDLGDWLEQSSQMDRVYTHSYCNISATAAEDSDQGLFRDRDQSTSWVETVSLRLDDDGGHIDCRLFDLSFWQEIVENAPVNKRSWVFQERLLAPRVIHWCKDQIAFECRATDKAECLPHGLLHYQEAADVIEEVKLKGIDVETGRRLYELRKPGSTELPHEKYYLYEVWKRLVEIYSKMELTNKRDRLIALSGIAGMMTSVLEDHGVKDKHIAGMWKNHMASQLLWHVNDGDRQVRQPLANTRVKYRAPSFSWASVESDRGITFPETLANTKIAFSEVMSKEGLLIEVEVMRLTYEAKKNSGTNDDIFGLLKDGYLVLRGILRKIELIDEARKPADEARKLLNDGKKCVDEEVQMRAKGGPWNASILSDRELADKVVAYGAVPVLVVFGATLCLVPRFGNTGAVITSCLCAALVLSISLLLPRLGASRQPTVLKKLADQEETLSGVATTHEAVEKHQAHISKNRYKWGLVKDGKVDHRHSAVWLDSPASEPSIFGPDRLIFCLPAAKDNENLTCIILQAVLNGEYGVRYRRVGLAKVSNRSREGKDIEDIVKPPGKADRTMGEYYYGEGGETEGLSTICII